MKAKPTVGYSADGGGDDDDDDIIKVLCKWWSGLFTARYGRLNWVFKLFNKIHKDCGLHAMYRMLVTVNRV